jgi:hypothetical protein
MKLFAMKSLLSAGLLFGMLGLWNVPQAQAADELVLSNGSLGAITVFYKLAGEPQYRAAVEIPGGRSKNFPISRNDSTQLIIRNYLTKQDYALNSTQFYPLIAKVPPTFPPGIGQYYWLEFEVRTMGEQPVDPPVMAKYGCVVTCENAYITYTGVWGQGPVSVPPVPTWPPTLPAPNQPSAPGLPGVFGLPPIPPGFGR